MRDALAFGANDVAERRRDNRPHQYVLLQSTHSENIPGLSQLEPRQPRSASLCGDTNLDLVRSGVRSSKAIAAATFGLYVLRSAGSAQLGTEAAHKHLQVFGTGLVVAPTRAARDALSDRAAA